MERGSLGWRQLLATVNLRDFAVMILNEVGLIGTSLRGTLRSLPNLPLGPFLALAIVLLAILRLVLLASVVFVLGSAILVTMLIRGVVRAVRSRAAGS